MQEEPRLTAGARRGQNASVVWCDAFYLANPPKISTGFCAQRAARHARAPRVALLQLKQRETESMTMSPQTIDATANGNDGENEMNAVTTVPSQDVLLTTPSRTAMASVLLAHAKRVKWRHSYGNEG
jgi:hypothetical protein